MRPQAQNYVYPALLLVFGINKLMLLVLPKVNDLYLNLTILLFTLVQVSVVTFFIMKFNMNSDKYKAAQRLQSHQQSTTPR